MCQVKGHYYLTSTLHSDLVASAYDSQNLDVSAFDCCATWSYGCVPLKTLGAITVEDSLFGACAQRMEFFLAK